MIHTLANIIVLAGTGQPPAPGSGLGDLLSSPFMLLMVLMVVFMLFMGRSNKRRQQQRRDMISAVKPKDDVVTIGGIHGRVVQATDDVLVLRIDQDKDIKITIQRSGISRKLGEPEQE